MDRYCEPELSGRHVIVTGASGFIGRQLTAGLCQSGAIVTVLVRTKHRRVELESLGARVVLCSLTDQAGLLKAMAGCKTLFHFAYDVRAPAHENIEVFDCVMAAARQAGITQVIHASSVVVYDRWPSGTIDETSPIGSAGGGMYRQAKIAMEHRLMQSGLAVAILQPTIVYGPGSTLWTDAPLLALRCGGLVLPDPVGLCPAVYVDDVVQAALQSAIMVTDRPERFVISGPDTLTWRDFYRAYAAMIGTGDVISTPFNQVSDALGGTRNTSHTGPGLAEKFSARLRKVFGQSRFEAFVGLVRTRLAGQSPTLPDRERLELYTGNPQVSIQLARERLRFTPNFHLKDGISSISNYYNDHQSRNFRSS
ncbi:NAD(P)-dependent oxidoreductase [Pseudoruegeria sp. SK021]|uniref:NAD-dependent epimerase/dehydratase family protein n=1 Tax=Pseudoruegeria sp. SK021 TaxID=1933035 RepID=UPI000A2564DB|nr:NAD(P)H-binding protein [Pseudoruegeria sp. SK021]OSP55079.1 hypothetical protein BV911_09675 [Pseudoruegeria sp. SK021]